MAGKKELGHLAIWARQSIAFAMSIRAEESGKPLDSADLAQWAGKEAQALTDEFWAQAVGECGGSPSDSEVIIVYVKKVFGWCYSHMNPAA